MYVRPQSTFRLLADVPFNDDLKHTIYFTTKEKQLQFFESKIKYNFMQFTYVRQTNTVKVPMSADQLYDCNYCMFNNGSDRGSKWFYAFITGIEYINETTSEISFQIDYFQTWRFDINIGKCFVEREHVADDTIGKHTLDEGLYYGENIPMHFDSKYFKDWKIIIQVRPSPLGGFLEGDKPTDYGWNQAFPLSYLTDASNVQGIHDWLTPRLIAGNEVVGMYMIPSDFQIPTTQDVDDKYADKQLWWRGEDSPRSSLLVSDMGVSYFERPTQFHEPKEDTSHDYIPKNNKLLTYPYNYLKVTTTEGEERDFKWENTAFGEIGFFLYDNLVNSASCYIKAPSYFGDGSKMFTVPINQFPDVTYSINTFLQKAPVALVGSAIKTLGSGGVGQIIAGSQMKTPKTKQLSSKGAKMMAKGIDKLATPSADMLETINSGMMTPYSTHVASTNNALGLKFNQFGYEFYKMGIRKEYAKVIDDYFTRFGYKVNTYKVPELISRSAFNFVKTVDCNVTGDAPNEALEVISNMFDSGITLWHITDVGNYNISNNKL